MIPAMKAFSRKIHSSWISLNHITTYPDEQTKTGIHCRSPFGLCPARITDIPKISIILGTFKKGLTGESFNLLILASWGIGFNK